MEAQAARQTHPLIIIAAIAITLFSLVGIGAVLGWIPTSVGNPGAASAPVAQVPEQPAAQPEEAKPAEPKPAVKPKPKPVVKSEPPRAVAVVPPPPPIVAAICRECAVIEEVREVEKAGQASGAGAVGGAVVGGVIGHQMGGGRGRDVATVLGALGGGLAGNQIEKNAIVVRYEDGTKGLFIQATPPSWRPGDKVKVINGVIQGRG